MVFFLSESGNSRDSNEPPVIDLTISSDSESDSEDIKIERKHPHDMASALSFDLDQEIQRDLLQTPPVETQLSPAPGTPISDSPSITTGSPSSPVSPNIPGPSRSPQGRVAGRLTDILDQDYARQDSSLPYPCSPLTDYHRGHMDSDREGVNLMQQSRRLVDPLHTPTRKKRPPDRYGELIEDISQCLRKRKRGDDLSRENRSRLR